MLKNTPGVSRPEAGYKHRANYAVSCTSTSFSWVKNGARPLHGVLG